MTDTQHKDKGTVDQAGKDPAGRKTSEDTVELSQAVVSWPRWVPTDELIQQQGTRVLPELTWALTKMDHFLGRKPHLSQFKKTEVMQYLLSSCNRIQLEISSGEGGWRAPDTWRL